MKRSLLVWASLALAAPAGAQDMSPTAMGGCAVVPLLRAAVPAVEVTIGGKGPYRFAVDTGAPGHGRISPKLAAELGLPKMGAAAEGPLFGVTEVSVGGVSFKNLDLVASQAAVGEWDGSLGSALIELLPLTLDYGNARARFGGTGLAEGLPISFQDGVPILPIDIAGKRFRVSFASGEAAGALFMDEDTARGLPISGEPVPRAGNGAQGAEAALPVAVTVSGVPLTVRAVNWPSPRPGGLLGSRAMTGLSVTFDAAAQLGKVERSGLPPRCPTSPSGTN